MEQPMDISVSEVETQRHTRRGEICGRGRAAWVYAAARLLLWWTAVLMIAWGVLCCAAVLLLFRVLGVADAC